MDNVIKCVPISDSSTIESSLNKTLSGDNEEAKLKILAQTIADEKSSNSGKAVHLKAALKAFEKKIKDMDPIEITNAETPIEKKIELLAELSAQEKNKNFKIVEGDMIETELLRALMNNNTAKRAIQRRMQIGPKWGTIIPYELPESITHGVGLFERSINEALREISRVSCLKFVKRLNDGRSKNNKDVDGKPEAFLKFVRGNGCFTYPGKQNIDFLQSLTDSEDYGHPIYIGRYCEFKGTVIHEILHALGFLHEHTRLDRDKYIKINWENIIDDPSERLQFRNYRHGDADGLGLGYDLDSIMHYSKDAASKNGKNTIDVIGDPQRVIGLRHNLSQIDKLQLRRLYCTLEEQQKYRNLRKKNWNIISKNLYASGFHQLEDLKCLS
ncbi:high choriolytic enzyme 1 isoform X4 [Hydra vulgaris]|uniref:Metalloendopeptidase n=1 Tax=Hydra vulgaris TaxID=6087 RepID=A0ABM4DQ97_HYDVU